MNWPDALAEHGRVLAAFVAALDAVPEVRWHAAPDDCTWSAAALSLHVADSYAFGLAAARGEDGMRLRVPRAAAWFARRVLLPRMLAAERFPRGAEAPAEVRPDLERARAFDQAGMREHLRTVAESAASALREAAEQRPAVRITHAYFGPLRPLAALRLLSAHTRHHAGGLRWRASGRPAR